MRTLSEITAAVRKAEDPTNEELRYAVVAYDVMIAQMELDNDPARLFHYFQAADSDPRAYIGEANDPALLDARQWYRAMHEAGQAKVCPDCQGAGRFDRGQGRSRKCEKCNGTGAAS